MAILVFGHKNPDTDSVVAAIAEAAMLNSREGAGTAEARVQGEVTPETKFVLEKFGLPTPEMLGDVSGQDVALVDTTNSMELPEEIEEANIRFVFDHHRLGGLNTTSPFEGWFRPYGSTCTILKKVADEYGDEIPQEIAGAMVCAILSDTVLFRSPTTTDDDREVVGELAKIAGIDDYMELGLEMLKVKSAIEDDSATDLINRDFKEFDFGGKKMGIGQIELVDITMFYPKRLQVVNEMKKMREERGYWGVMMLITDVMKEGSLILIDSEDNARVGEILKRDLSSGEGYIDKMMSRKKQVVAPLSAEL